jgi:hypothetical protein
MKQLCSDANKYSTTLPSNAATLSVALRGLLACHQQIMYHAFVSTTHCTTDTLPWMGENMKIVSSSARFHLIVRPCSSGHQKKFLLASRIMPM